VATRSVRLDEEAEDALADIRRQSGQSISSAIKLSLISYRESAREAQGRRPSDFFAAYDLGMGGYALGPARDSKRLLKDKLSKRHHNR
jgi:hypothetical protein